MDMSFRMAAFGDDDDGSMLFRPTGFASALEKMKAAENALAFDDGSMLFRPSGFGAKLNNSNNNASNPPTRAPSIEEEDDLRRRSSDGGRKGVDHTHVTTTLEREPSVPAAQVISKTGAPTKQFTVSPVFSPRRDSIPSDEADKPYIVPTKELQVQEQHRMSVDAVCMMNKVNTRPSTSSSCSSPDGGRRCAMEPYGRSTVSTFGGRTPAKDGAHNNPFEDEEDNTSMSRRWTSHGDDTTTDKDGRISELEAEVTMLKEALNARVTRVLAFSGLTDFDRNEVEILSLELDAVPLMMPRSTQQQRSILYGLNVITHIVVPSLDVIPPRALAAFLRLKTVVTVGYVHRCHDIGLFVQPREEDAVRLLQAPRKLSVHFRGREPNAEIHAALDGILTIAYRESDADIVCSSASQLVRELIRRDANKK